MKLKCTKCGNKMTFYREVSVVAKMQVRPDGTDTNVIQSVDTNNQDNYFTPIYCACCNTLVHE